MLAQSSKIICEGVRVCDENRVGRREGKEESREEGREDGRKEDTEEGGKEGGGDGGGEPVSLWKREERERKRRESEGREGFFFSFLPSSSLLNLRTTK